MIEYKYAKIITELKKFYNSIKPLDKFIIGLSGGIDSAVVAALCVAAIGKENIITYNLPSKFNSTITKNNAKYIAERLGVQYNITYIENLINAFKDVYGLGKSLENEKHLENLQARLRGILLQEFAAANNGVCICCGNKTENAVGYFTFMDASMVGAISPIGDLYKTEVFEMAEYINSEFMEESWPIPGNLIPSLNRVDYVYPSAELSENQKDPFNYGPDDFIIKWLTENDILDWDTFQYQQHFDDIEDFKKRIHYLDRLIEKNRWKVKRLPPIIKC